MKDIEIEEIIEKDFGNISYMLSMVAESGEYQYGADA